MWTNNGKRPLNATLCFDYAVDAMSDLPIAAIVTGERV